MPDKAVHRTVALTFFALAAATSAYAATVPAASQRGMTLWQLILSGGLCMVFLAVISVATVALIIYHFLYVTAERLVPQDFTENLLSLLDRKEFAKATSLSKQQTNLISGIALKGLQKAPKGAALMEEAIQFEGRSRVESLWQNLTYLGDIAVIAPMVGLLGTIFGMIDAFNYFKAATLSPALLTQGLAKAMINTAFGLVIAVPALAFYSYFRGRLARITSTAEAVTAEIVQLVNR